MVRQSGQLIMSSKTKSTTGKALPKQSRFKKSGGRSAARKRISSDTVSGSGSGKVAGRSDVTKKLWASIKKHGLSDRNSRRPIFNTSVRLRHLDATDIAKMVSVAKVDLS
jgi:hypothetical protein